MTLDLIVANATILSRSGRCHIGIEGGRIAEVSSEPLDDVESSKAQVVDAGGGLVTESFINAHLHLDKVYTANRLDEAALDAYTAGDMGGAMTSIELASSVKDEYDESWIESNARRALADSIRYGTRHVLAFADVDTKARLIGIKPLLRLRDEFRGVVDLQVVAFPQDGLLRDPGAEELVREAVDLGADVVGGIPWIELSDADSAEHVRRMCALAAARDRRVAMLVDDAGDPTLRTTEMLALELLRHGLPGKGTAHHARAVATYAEPSIRRLGGLARDAGLGFVSDPHTGALHLPVRAFWNLGLSVALGQDDIADAYYPMGRNNLIEVAFLAAHLLNEVSADGLHRVYGSVTTMAADVLGIEGHRLGAGGNADLVVHDRSSLRDVLAYHEAPRYVIASGRVVASTVEETTFDLPSHARLPDGVRT